MCLHALFKAAPIADDGPASISFPLLAGSRRGSNRYNSAVSRETLEQRSIRLPETEQSKSGEPVRSDPNGWHKQEMD